MILSVAVPSGRVHVFVKAEVPNSVSALFVCTVRVPSVIVILKSSLSNPGAATEIICLSSSVVTLVFLTMDVLLVGIVTDSKNGSKRESKRLSNVVVVGVL